MSKCWESSPMPDIYNVSQKKLCHFYFYCNLGKGNFSFLLWAISFWFRHWKNFKNRPTFAKVTVKIKVAVFWLTVGWVEHGLRSAPTQYRLYGRPFYRSDDPTNSIRVLKEIYKIQIKERKQLNTHIYMHNNQHKGYYTNNIQQVP